MLIVFDKDGTLLDTERTWASVVGLLVSDLAQDDANTYGLLCATLGYEPTEMKLLPDALLRRASLAQIRNIPGFGHAMASWFESLNFARVQFSAMASLRELFLSLRSEGHRIAVLTNDSRVPTEAFVRQQGILDLLDFIVCAKDGFPMKPSPLGFLHIARTVGVDVQDCAMVGDSAEDMLCAVSAGAGLIVGIASDEDSASSLRLAGAQTVVQNVSELPDLARARTPRCTRSRTTIQVPPTPPRPDILNGCSRTRCAARPAEPSRGTSKLSPSADTTAGQ
jgi:phosphoglycolate phosphatase